MESVRLVLLHGTQLNSAQWLGYAAALPGIDVQTPDLPAHGTRRDQPFTWAAAMAVIDSAVSGASPGTRVVLAGHSLGGYLATAYAADCPGRLAGLGLLGAAGEPGGRGAASYRVIARVNRRLGPARMSRILDRQLRRLGTPAATADALLAAGYSFTGVTPAWTEVMARCGSAQLAEFTGDVLLVAGQFDQLRIHTRRYAAAARSARSVRIVTVPRASHAFPLSHREQTTAELARLCAADPHPIR
ncbi:MAG: alpha/beta hydrolase [Tetrasphaera sp.]